MRRVIRLRDIAGFCPEEAVWKMMADVASFLLQTGCGYEVGADTIVADGNTFLIESERVEISTTDMVWDLGAVAYYAVTGHVIFGGYGKAYQQSHPQVALPMLPKTFQALNPLIHKCIRYDIEKRIGIAELSSLARNGYMACNMRRRDMSDANKVQEAETKKQSYKWPEEMIEI